jgi:hypothetical protein
MLGNLAAMGNPMMSGIMNMNPQVMMMMMAKNMQMTK